VVVEIWEEVVRMTQSLKDRETRFGGPGMLRTRATEGSGAERGETGATEGLGKTHRLGPYARYALKPMTWVTACRELLPAKERPQPLATD
jgi:hypothetical protein